MPPENVHRREQEFHDSLAAHIAADSEPPGALDELDRDLLMRVAPLANCKVLEIGCGIGDLTLALLATGAAVTALDISRGMIDTARSRAERFSGCRQATWLVAAAEQTGLPDESFDFVVGKWILHHSDVPSLADEISRVLRPGGRGVFIENSGINPVLSFARRRLAGRWHIPRYGTEDEHPLVEQDFEQFQRRFRSVELHYPDFCFFQLFDRQITRLRWPRFTRAVRALDARVWRSIPRARPYSFHVVVELEK